MKRRVIEKMSTSVDIASFAPWKFEKLINDIEKDNSPIPGSRVGRFSSEPANMTKKYSRKKMSDENASIERFKG